LQTAEQEVQEGNYWIYVSSDVSISVMGSGKNYKLIIIRLIRDLFLCVVLPSADFAALYLTD
jgi:hypothetical protein